MNLIEWKSKAESLATQYGTACASRDSNWIGKTYLEMKEHLSTDPDLRSGREAGHDPRDAVVEAARTATSMFIIYGVDRTVCLPMRDAMNDLVVAVSRISKDRR